MKTAILMIVVLHTMVIAASAAPSVSATYEWTGSAYLYRFTVEMGEEVYGQGIGWGLYAVGFTDLVAPDGWQAGMDYRTTGWDATLPQYCIPAGGVLIGCTARSALLRTGLPYFISVTGEGTTHFGTLTPVPIPEPSSLLALGSGLVALGGLVRRRRR